jgi:hypothetical protein
MPQNVIAWAVAVEKYGGTDLNIKQPVGAWALEFAETMLRKGASRVVLSTSLSFETEYRPRLEKLELSGSLRRTGATQADIQNALDQIQGGDALFLYWVGHGIMAPYRQLLCADSTNATTTRSITVDSLLKRLRSTQFARLQIGFFESCAQVVMSTPASLDLGGVGNTPTQQYFYYAASAAETASASTARVGFSATVLQKLAEVPVLPPPPDEFFGVLKAALNNLSGPTRPFQMERTDGSGDVWSSGISLELTQIEEAAAVAQLTRSQFERLWQHAVKAGKSPVEFANALLAGRLAEFLADFGAVQPNSGEPKFLERAAEQLALEQAFEPLCLNLKLLWREWLAFYDRLVNEQLLSSSQSAIDLPGLLLNVLNQLDEEKRLRDFANLLELAARRSKDLSASDELRNAMRSHKALGPAYASVLSKLSADDDRLYLLLDIDWEPNTKMASLKKAWIFPGLDGLFESREVPGSGELADQINTVVQRILEAYPERPLVIEVLSPNELLSMPAELLKMLDPEIEISTWLEAEHPVTLRWKARLQDKNNRYRGTWAQKAHAACDRAESAKSLACQWRPPAGAEGKYHVLALTFPGPCPAQPSRNKASFFSELVKGEPFMCWPRNEPADANKFRQASTEFFSTVSLKRLPSALCDGRSDPILVDLVVLIDLPQRNPYSNELPLTETGQRGTT